jgi:poly(3-hydroxybutyrate) depolymerase
MPAASWFAPSSFGRLTERTGLLVIYPDNASNARSLSVRAGKRTFRC